MPQEIRMSSQVTQSKIRGTISPRLNSFFIGKPPYSRSASRVLILETTISMATLL